MWRTGRAMSSPEFDVLLFPTIYSFVPTFSRARKIVVIHDVIAETYPHLTVPRTAARLSWNAKVALGRYQANAIVTVSDYSRRGIVERFGSDPARVFVVGEASDPVFRRLDDPQPTAALRQAGIDGAGRTIVYVGGFSPHKNLGALVQAFAGLARQGGFEDVRLVMVGEYRKEVFHSYYSTIAAQIDSLGLRDRVAFTGYLPDPELVVLLNLGAVLVLPSLMEGFGLPAVEAAACGCPVIATTASPLPGLLAGAGLFIDPGEEQIGKALRTILASEELRRSMSAAGIAAAGRLTWEAAARQMSDVIRQVARN
jgi:glycosyltransferase involved in cell wall biosynthesis